MKYKLQKGFIHFFLLLIFALVVFFGIGYFAYTNRQTKISQSSDRSDLYTNEKSVNNDGWKKYVDNKNSFEIMYPKDWNVEKACLGGSPNDTYICLKSSDLELNPVPSVVKGQIITIGTRGSSFFPNGNLSPSEFCNPDVMSKIRSCEQFNLEGLNGFKKVYDNYAFIDVAIIKNSEIKFVLRLQYPHEQLSSSPEFAAFDQILSTFKFIEITNEDSISFPRVSPGKIVYGTSQNPDNIDKAKADCDQRNGIFNSCGSLCDNANDICPTVCAVVCTF